MSRPATATRKPVCLTCGAPIPLREGERIDRWRKLKFCRSTGNSLSECLKKYRATHKQSRPVAEIMPQVEQSVMLTDDQQYQINRDCLARDRRIEDMPLSKATRGAAWLFGA